MKKAFALAIVASFALSGCLTWGPVETWPCKVIGIATYAQGQSSNDLDEVHVIVDEVTLRYAGPEGNYDQEQTFVKKVNIDLSVAQATGNYAVFAGEDPIPCGKYRGMTVSFREAYGIQDGQRVPIELATYQLDIDADFGGDEEEIRVLLDMKGKVHENAAGFFWKNHLQRAVFTNVIDAESGEEVHDVGQLVELPEASSS